MKYKHYLLEKTLLLLEKKIHVHFEDVKPAIIKKKNIFKPKKCNDTKHVQPSVS